MNRRRSFQSDSWTQVRGNKNRTNRNKNRRNGPEKERVPVNNQIQFPSLPSQVGKRSQDDTKNTVWLNQPDVVSDNLSDVSTTDTYCSDIERGPSEFEKMQNHLYQITIRTCQAQNWAKNKDEKERRLGFKLTEDDIEHDYIALLDLVEQKYGQGGVQFLEELDEERNKSYEELTGQESDYSDSDSDISGEYVSYNVNTHVDDIETYHIGVRS